MRISFIDVFKDKHVYSFILFGTLLLTLTSCTPRLKPQMTVPQIPLMGKVERLNTVSQTYLYVDDVHDGRPTTVLAEIEGQESNPATDVGFAVRDALSNAFQQKGFVITESAPVIISGEVRKWKANVRGHFPTSIRSEASLYLEVFDPTNKKVYSGLYHGSAGLEQPSVNEDKIREVLSTSMAQAISQVLSDEELVGLLSSF